MKSLDDIKQELLEALPGTTWTKDDGPPSDDYDAITYRGVGPSKWAFLVVTWVSHSKKHQGQDGTAVHDGVIFHLTPELAKAARESAEEWTRANK